MGGAVSAVSNVVSGVVNTLTGGVLNPPKVPKGPVAPAREDPAVQEARRKALAQENQARGRRSTLLTGGRGVTGPAPVERARLLGGTA